MKPSTQQPCPCGAPAPSVVRSAPRGRFLPESPAAHCAGAWTGPRRGPRREKHVASAAPGRATEKPDSCSQRAPRVPGLPPSPLRAKHSAPCVESCAPCQDGRPCRQGLGWGWLGAQRGGGGLSINGALCSRRGRSRCSADGADSPGLPPHWEGDVCGRSRWRSLRASLGSWGRGMWPEGAAHYMTTCHIPGRQCPRCRADQAQVAPGSHAEDGRAAQALLP